MESLFFSLYFSLYTIFSDTATLEKPLSTKPYGKLGWDFFSLLPICLHAKNQCDPIIPSGDICDQRILQSTWLKGFLILAKEQELTQIWDLYSKIDNNINFYLNTFPAKINDQNFQNKWKTLLGGHFWARCVVFAQRKFLHKNLAN